MVEQETWREIDALFDAAPGLRARRDAVRTHPGAVPIRRDRDPRARVLR